MRVLVLGGIGYVGGRLTAHLKQAGHYVRVTTRRPKERIPSWLKTDEVLQADPLKKETLASVFASMDIAIDLAAPDEVEAAKHPEEALTAGKDGTHGILQALCASPRPPAFIYLSTFHVYGANAKGQVDERTLPAPLHPYAIGKYEGEIITQDFRQKKNLTALCVRLSNAFGAPAGHTLMRETLVFNDLCRQAVDKHELVLKTTGIQKRNFIPLSDVVSALEFLAQHREAWPEDGILHLGSDIQWSIRDAAEKISQTAQDVLGFKPPVVVPAGAPAEKGSDFVFSIERLKKLGFQAAGAWKKEVEATLAVCRDAAHA